MYNPSITLEAAKDIVDFNFNNPKMKFVKAEVQDTGLEVPKQMLVLYYAKDGIDYEKEGMRYSELQIPIPNVIEMLHFAMKTITDAHELTEGYR